MLEAMATGRSIVATDVPGAGEALDGAGGPLVQPEDPGRLGSGDRAEAARPERAAAEGSAARERVEQTYPRDLTRAGVADSTRSPLSSSTEPTIL